MTRIIYLELNIFQLGTRPLSCSLLTNCCMEQCVCVCVWGWQYLERSDRWGAGTGWALRSFPRGLMGGCTQIYCFPSAPPAANTLCTYMCRDMLVSHTTMNAQCKKISTTRCSLMLRWSSSYLRQAEVDWCRFRDVHDFTISSDHKHKAIQSLREQKTTE